MNVLEKPKTTKRRPSIQNKTQQKYNLCELCELFYNKWLPLFGELCPSQVWTVWSRGSRLALASVAKSNFSHPTLRTNTWASLNWTHTVTWLGNFWKLLESRMKMTSSPYPLKIPYRWQEFASYNATLCSNAKFKNNAQIKTKFNPCMNTHFQTVLKTSEKYVT